MSLFKHTMRLRKTWSRAADTLHGHGKNTQDEQDDARSPNGDKKRVPPPEGLFEQQYSQRRKRLREERAQNGDARCASGRPPQQRQKNYGSRLDAPPEQHSHGQEDGPQQGQPEITGAKKKEKRYAVPE